MTAKSPVLTLSHITKTYVEGGGPLTVLSDVSLSLYPGEIAGLIGSSGCGKSTLLNIAGLLDTPTSGTVTLLGTPTQALSDSQKSLLRRDHIGFIFQFHHLLSEFSVLENVLMPLRLAGRLTEEGRARGLDLLEQVGLTGRKDAFPAQLSGGERQRAAVVRSLISGPQLLLADEPTGNLDEGNSAIVFNLFLALVKRAGCAALIVTHNESLVAQMPTVYRIHKGKLEDQTR